MNEPFMAKVNFAGGKQLKPQFDGERFSLQYRVASRLMILSDELYKDFIKKQEQYIIHKLFFEYKKINICSLYVLNEDEFKRFLLEMLPVWLKKEKKYVRKSKSKSSR